MLSYCLKCRKNTESKNPKVVKTKKGRIMLLSKCAMCYTKKLKFIKEQEASGLLRFYFRLLRGLERFTKKNWKKKEKRKKIKKSLDLKM